MLAPGSGGKLGTGGGKGGRSGGARFGVAGGASIEEEDGSLRLPPAVEGGSVRVLVDSLGPKVERLCEENLEERLRADAEGLPRIRGWKGAKGCTGGGQSCGSSSSTGDVVRAGWKGTAEEEDLVLWPGLEELLGWLRCDRSETDRLTFCPISVTLVNDSTLLCRRRDLFLASTSMGGLRRLPPSNCCSTAAFRPVNLPNTVAGVVAREGMAGGPKRGSRLDVRCRFHFSAVDPVTRDM